MQEIGELESELDDELEKFQKKLKWVGTSVSATLL
jgi:hypothetical protein